MEKFATRDRKKQCMQTPPGEELSTVEKYGKGVK